MTNKVWIELFIDPDPATNHQRAELATNMVRKLGVTAPCKFWFHEGIGRYCYTMNEAQEFVELVQNGHAFNLDYFGEAGIGRQE